MELEVLRLGHRLPRDERISTHVALVSRAFGASSIVYSGQHDQGLEDSVERICARWGGKAGGGQFPIRYEKSAIPYLKKRKKDGYFVVHLTMYGISARKALPDMAGREKILVVVGSEAVPAEVYHLSDLNLSITNQPHSEVAALAVFLDRLLEGKALDGFDHHGKIRIEPMERGKKVIG